MLRRHYKIQFRVLRGDRTRQIDDRYFRFTGSITGGSVVLYIDKFVHSLFLYLIPPPHIHVKYHFLINRQCI